MIMHHFAWLALVPSVVFAELQFDDPPFQVPPDWGKTKLELLENVDAYAIAGTGRYSEPPILTLTRTQMTHAEESEYFKFMKHFTETSGFAHYRYMGPIRTKSGLGHLCIVDSETKRGKLRVMQLSFFTSPFVYTLSASALFSEFSSHIEAFVEAFRSFDVTAMKDKNPENCLAQNS